MYMVQYQIHPINKVVLQIQEIELPDNEDPIIEYISHREGDMIERSRDQFWQRGMRTSMEEYLNYRREWLKDHLTVWSRWTVNYKEVQALRKWYRSLNVMQQLGML